MKPREPCAGRNAASGFVQLKNKFIMGHFSLDFKKAKGSSDARESDHIERKVIPDNADPTRTHLNRELVKMPSVCMVVTKPSPTASRRQASSAR